MIFLFAFYLNAEELFVPEITPWYYHNNRQVLTQVLIENQI